MKISICGSMAFIDQMEQLATDLRLQGLSVVTPAREEAGLVWADLDLQAAIRAKTGYVLRYLEKIRRSDAVLVANYDKAGIAGYVGPNLLIEAAFALALGKPRSSSNHQASSPASLRPWP